MSMTRSKDRSPWRQKYLELVEEHDLIKLQMHRREKILLRGLSKVTLAAKGQDVALDASLSAFRRVINDTDNEDLDSQLKKLDNSIHCFDQYRFERNMNLAEAIVGSLQRFQALNISASDKRQIKQFTQQLTRASKNSIEYFDIDLWLEKANVIQAAMLEHHLSTELTVSPEVNQLDSLAANFVVETQKEQLLPQLDRQANEGKELPAEATTILLKMLAEMNIPAEAEQFTAPLYHQLQNGLDIDSLAIILDRFAVILGATLSRDHREFDSFLQPLDEDVETLTAYLTFSEQNQNLFEQHLSSFFQQLYARLDSLDFNAGAENAEHALRHMSFLIEDFRLVQIDHETQLRQRFVGAKSVLSEVSSRVDLAVVELQKRRERLLRDQLTGLPSQDAYSLRAQQEFDRWQRYQRPLSLVAVNIDKLKSFNQTFGYPNGDRVIQVVAKNLQENIRKTDFLARAVNCDFVLLLPELSKSQMVAVLDKFAASIEHCNFNFVGQAAVTLSLGAAEFKAGDDLNSAIRRAEKSLSIASLNGGNCSYCIN